MGSRNVKSWEDKMNRLAEAIEKKGLAKEAKDLRDLTDDIRQNGSSWYMPR